MANTLTGLIPVLYEALDVVGAEKVGFIGSVALNASAEGAAKDETVRVPIVPAASASATWSPAQAAPNTGDITVGYTDITIDNAKTQPVRINGEEERGLRNAGLKEAIMRDRFAQAFRMLRNEMELAVATAAYQGASRAWGTAGTAPFASDLLAAGNMQKILDDNGCPDGDRFLVIDSAAALNLFGLNSLTNMGAAGTDRLLRQGLIDDLAGFVVKKSGQVVAHTAGAMTGFQSDATLAAGSTTLTFDGGTVNTTGCKAGDIITIGTGGGSGTGTDYDTKYVVNTGSTSTSGSIVIGSPGLLVGRVDNDEITIGSSYRANVAFHKSAIQLVARPIAFPEDGDNAKDRTLITDPVTGITYVISMYGEYGQMHYSIGIAYGVKAIKPNHIAILLG